jgi:hypothetical protein
MDHCNHDCKHENVKFCDKCQKVYCKDCGKEWPQIVPCYNPMIIYEGEKTVPYWQTPIKTTNANDYRYYIR